MKVSVIIPCYNQAIFLFETVNSVIKQTFSDWECIIVNDGSPDNTEQVAKLLCEKDSRVRYIYKPNGGISDARNVGIKSSSGQYILPLDSDDMIGETYIEKAVRILDDNLNVKIVYCREEFFGIKKGENIFPVFDMNLMLSRNLIFCSALFRRSDYDETCGYSTNMKFGLEDWDFWLSMLETGGDVYKIDEVLFYYRIRRNSRNANVGLGLSEKQTMMRRQLWENHKELFSRYFLDPKESFEFHSVICSKEYRLGSMLLKPIRRLFNLFCR